MNDHVFREGIAAAKAGDMVTARKSLSNYVKQNPESEKGWLALGYCLDDVKLKVFCYQQVLKLNPKNEKAKKLLHKIDQPQTQDAEPVLTSVEQPKDQDVVDKAPRQNRITIPTIIGFFLGFIVVGGLLLNFVNSNPPIFFDRFANAFVSTPEIGQDGNQIASTSEAQLSILPTWTPISTPIPTSDRNPTPSSPPSMSQRLIDNYSKVENATQLMLGQNFAEAIIAWDEIITAVPEYPDAYFSRGMCYLFLTFNQRSLAEYIENSQKAYDDFTRAIEIGPPNGEYYFRRAKAIRNLIDQYEYTIDMAPLIQERLDDTLMAFSLGHHDPWGTRHVANALLDAGYCEEALDYLLRLEEIRGEDKTPSAAISGSIANSYFCLKQYEKALDYSEIAISIKESRDEDIRWEIYRHVKILIALKQYQEAHDLINKLIEDTPYYAGYRYYVRALTYYEMGEPELAYEDLLFGSSQTWLQYGYRAYVLALLALDEGDEDSALHWLQIAEASLSNIALPHLYESTRKELDNLGGTLLFPAPTPSPTPVASPTPIPVIPDHVFFTPTPAVAIPSPSLANYSGTGIFYLGAGDETNFLFRPTGYHNFHSIESLTLKITAEDFSAGSQLSAYYMLLDGSGFVGSIPLFIGENEIFNPYKLVSDAGYFHVKFRNDARFPVVIENVSVQLVVKNQDGTMVVYGYE